MENIKTEASQEYGTARRDLLTYVGSGALVLGIGSSTSVLQAQAQQIAGTVDNGQVQKVAQRIAKLLVDFSDDFQTFLDRSMRLRLQILSDIMRLVDSLEPRDKSCLLSLLLLEVSNQIGVPGVSGGKCAVSCNWLFIKWLQWPADRCDATSFAVQYEYIPLSG
jgi:hypothetical protein